MTKNDLEILFEDNHLLAVNKCSGIPTQGAVAGDASLFELAKLYLKRKYEKPGNVYLGVVSRLDSLVSGAVIFARTSKGAARLSEQYRERTVKKIYWALVSGKVDPAQGECVDWVLKDEIQKRMKIVKEGTVGAQRARLTYSVIKVMGDMTLLEVHPITGRKHQIRLQLGARGYPILGDDKYGSKRPFSKGIALHSRQLTVEHPTLKTPVESTAPLPEGWKQFGVEAD